MLPSREVRSAGPPETRSVLAALDCPPSRCAAALWPASRAGTCQSSPQWWAQASSAVVRPPGGRPRWQPPARGAVSSALLSSRARCLLCGKVAEEAPLCRLGLVDARRVAGPAWLLGALHRASEGAPLPGLPDRDELGGRPGWPPRPWCTSPSSSVIPLPAVELPLLVGLLRCVSTSRVRTGRPGLPSIRSPAWPPSELPGAGLVQPRHRARDRCVTRRPPPSGPCRSRDRKRSGGGADLGRGSRFLEGVDGVVVGDPDALRARRGASPNRRPSRRGERPRCRPPSPCAPGPQLP